ncbi:NAD(P)/FAD-dependent oxidoreductase [Candidatus Saccharibacteria bacterium]|nr:NAD(P)/FAD-dependent oxidoreductase [Candidatus Saccharibacteria bacterium]
MNKKYNFDYIIIGSGPAGSTAALILAKSKSKKIALVEGEAFGGNNLNTRDIPYGVSLGFSHTFHRLSRYPEISSHDLRYNFPTVVAHQEHVVAFMSNHNNERYDKSNLTLIQGYANFLDKHTIAVGKKKYTAKTFIIATGSRLKTSEITGTDTVKYLTPNNALKLRRLPKFAFIVGGGSTGCEIAEYYAELGAKVLIMERAPRLLPREDAEASAVITDYFSSKLGVMVITDSKVVAIENDGKYHRVIFNTNGEEKMVRVDCIVLATGSEPDIEGLGLENAGVKYKKSGITVGKNFQTSTKHIYAIGDCINDTDSSTERAEYEATVLAGNLRARTKNLANYNGFIRITDTYPKVAAVGKNEQDLAKHKASYKKSVVEFKDLPVSKLERLNYGFVKVLADKNNRIIGATIVAPNAELMAEEFALAIRHKITALELASTPHVSNSWNAAVKLACRRLIKKR